LGVAALEASPQSDDKPQTDEGRGFRGLSGRSDIAFKPTAAINVHGAFPKNRSVEQ
jgi:hypothetical protein